MTLEQGTTAPDERPLSDQDIAAMVQAKLLLEGAESEALKHRGVAAALGEYMVAASAVPGFRGAIVASVAERETDTSTAGIYLHNLLDGDYDELGQHIFTLVPNDTVRQWSKLTRLTLDLGVKGTKLPVRRIGSHSVMNSGQINVDRVLADPKGYIDQYNQGQGFGSNEGRPHTFLGVLTPQRP